MPGLRHGRTGLPGSGAAAVRPLRPDHREASRFSCAIRRCRSGHVSAVPEIRSCSSTAAGCQVPPGRRYLPHLANYRSIAIDLPGFWAQRSPLVRGTLAASSRGGAADVNARCAGPRASAARGRHRLARCGRCAWRSKHPRASPPWSPSACPPSHLPGVCADPFFRLMTIPGVGRIASRVLPVPKSVKATRKGMKGSLGAGRAGRHARCVLRGGRGRHAHAGLA